MNLKQLSKNNDYDNKIKTSFKINISNNQNNDAFDFFNSNYNIILLEQILLTSNNIAIINNNSFNFLNGSCNIILSKQKASSINNNIVIIDDESFDLFNNSYNITLSEQASSTNNNLVMIKKDI
ncbi:36731_t:CDS:2 [Racocetra persica]|uniref:36731_t:CDS:1 n=1 Tax=Racocetra persica TaxID=160502 RepID=A0ACA9KMS9_9GLOM|nr:36731_t:CDS:2 [Racocetra persica]